MKRQEESKVLGQGMEMLLEVGMEIDLIADSGIRYVVESIETSPPCLVLSYQGESEMFPKKFILEGDNTLRFGRHYNPEFKFLGEMSREHAEISLHNSKFIYRHKGMHPAGIILPEKALSPAEQLIKEVDQFLEEQKQVQKLLAARKNKLLPHDQEITDINRLIYDIQANEEKIRQAQLLERHTFVTPSHMMDEGGHSEESLHSYGTLLECYKLLKADSLDEASLAALDKNIRIIYDLEKDREFLRGVENDSKNYKAIWGTYKKSERNGYSYSAQLSGYVDQKYEELERNGEVYMLGGVRGHHEIIKITKHKLPKGGFEYHQTTYNAGFEAEHTDLQGLVRGTVERKILDTSPAGLRDLIRTNTEKKIREPDGIQTQNYKKLKAAVEAFLDPTVLRSRDVTPQHKGNCTTRSTREMLRDDLDPKVFRDVYEFVSRPEELDPNKIIAALQLRKAELERLQHKEKAPEQSVVKNIRIEDLFVGPRVLPEEYKDAPVQFQMQVLNDKPMIEEDEIRKNVKAMAEELAKRGLRRLGRNEGLEMIKGFMKDQTPNEAEEKAKKGDIEQEDQKPVKGIRRQEKIDVQKIEEFRKKQREKILKAQEEQQELRGNFVAREEQQEKPAPRPNVRQDFLVYSQKIGTAFDEAFDRALQRKATEFGYKDYKLSFNPQIQDFKENLRSDLASALRMIGMHPEKTVSNWDKIIDNVASIIQPFLKESSLGKEFISMSNPGKRGTNFEAFREAWNAGLRGENIGKSNDFGIF